MMEGCVIAKGGPHIGRGALINMGRLASVDTYDLGGEGLLDCMQM